MFVKSLTGKKLLMFGALAALAGGILLPPQEAKAEVAFSVGYSEGAHYVHHDGWRDDWRHDGWRHGWRPEPAFPETVFYEPSFHRGWCPPRYREHHETVIVYQEPVTRTIVQPVVEPVYVDTPIEATPGRVVSDNPYCREYQRQVVVGGHVQESYGTACRQPDGAWKIVSE